MILHGAEVNISCRSPDFGPKLLVPNIEGPFVAIYVSTTVVLETGTNHFQFGSFLLLSWTSNLN